VTKRFVLYFGDNRRVMVRIKAKDRPLYGVTDRDKPISIDELLELARLS
jgi:hypothetical protein